MQFYNMWYIYAIQYVAFCVLFKFRDMFSRFIHAYSMYQFIIHFLSQNYTKLLRYKLCVTYHIELGMYFLPFGYYQYYYYEHSGTSICMDMCIQLSLILKNITAENGNFMFHFWRYAIILQNSCIILISTNSACRSSIFLDSHQHFS